MKIYLILVREIICPSIKAVPIRNINCREIQLKRRILYLINVAVSTFANSVSIKTKTKKYEIVHAFTLKASRVLNEFSLYVEAANKRHL